jgi:hypothetical protein
MERSNTTGFVVWSVLSGLFLLGSCLPGSSGAPASVPSLEATRPPTVTAAAFVSSTPTVAAYASPAISLPTTPAPLLLPEGPEPFRYVIEVTDLLADPYGQVQLFAPADGSVWLLSHSPAGDDSLSRWQDGRGEVILAANQEAFQATVDRTGRAWVLHQGSSEIEAWQVGAWRRYGANQGWTTPAESESGGWAPGPWGVSLARETVWLPTRLDVRAFDGERWRAYSLQEMGFPAPEWEEMGVTHRIAVLEEGEQVWVGECYYSGPGPMGGQGVRWFDGRAWRGGEAPVGADCVSVMEVDGTGRLWLGARDALWVFDPVQQIWSDYHLPQELLLGQNFSHPRDLLIDPDGDVWAILQMCGGASCDGPSNLYRIHKGEWSLVAQAEWWFEPLKELVMDASGQGWLFWEGGVYRLAGGDLLPVARLEARTVALDPAGGLWVLAGRGEEAALWRLDP